MTTVLECIGDIKQLPLIFNSSAFLEPHSSLEHSAKLYLISSDFEQFFTEQPPPPPTWKAESLCLCPPVRGWPSYTPSQRVPFSQGYCFGGIVTPPHWGILIYCLTATVV
jgi:hypothetical protein